jgi:hypothetical protein
MSDFDRCAPWLDAALKAQSRSLWTLDDVRKEIEAQEAYLWMDDAAAMVTTISDWPGANERLIESWLAGGEMEGVQRIRARAEDWAKQMGCTQVHVTGRAGWVRALAKFGYEPYTVTVRKML